MIRVDSLDIARRKRSTYATCDYQLLSVLVKVIRVSCPFKKYNHQMNGHLFSSIFLLFCPLLLKATTVVIVRHFTVSLLSESALRVDYKEEKATKIPIASVV